MQQIGAVFTDSARKIPAQPSPWAAGDFVNANSLGKPTFGVLLTHVGKELGIAVEVGKRPQQAANIDFIPR
jgi:hypothetical protein